MFKGLWCVTPVMRACEQEGFSFAPRACVPVPGNGSGTLQTAFTLQGV